MTELIVSGERQYREAQRRHYEWLVERKASLIEEIRKRKEEAARKEHERHIALEKARVDRLLSDAAALQRASVIRTYVEAVRIKCAEAEHSVPVDELERWANWALSQADQLDPVKSGRFLDSMRDRDTEDEAPDI